MEGHKIKEGRVANDPPMMGGTTEDRWSKYTAVEAKLVAEAKRKQRSTTESAKAALKVGNWLKLRCCISSFTAAAALHHWDVELTDCTPGQRLSEMATMFLFLHSFLRGALVSLGGLLSS